MGNKNWLEYSSAELWDYYLSLLDSRYKYYCQSILEPKVYDELVFEYIDAHIAMIRERIEKKGIVVFPATCI